MATDMMCIDNKTRGDKEKEKALFATCVVQIAFQKDTCISIHVHLRLQTAL